MRARWLDLAHLLLSLLLLLPGCFDSHGMPGPGLDAGPVGDAGACLLLPGTVTSLRCELRGNVGHAILETAPTWCCGSGTPSTDVSSLATSTGEAHTIDVSWEACDCCRDCRCFGPTQEVDVSLGELSPGLHRVEAGGSSCTIELFPPGPTCHAAFADEARFSRYLYADQSFATTVHAAGSGSCSCDPSLLDPAGLDLSSISLCGCCDVCDCLDLAYEVSVVVGALGLGTHDVVIPHGVTTTTVVARDATHPIDPPTSLRIVAPDPGAQAVGPPIHWAVVGGVEVLCCVEPAPVVDEGIGPSGEIVLSVASAAQSDCECVGGPVPYEAWYPLVALGSGRHGVRAGLATAVIDVP